jgi:arylsulfatase A-like enzyme
MRRIAVLLTIALALLACWIWLDARRLRGPSVLLITIDTLRADHLGAYGATHVVTPNIDRLAAAGLVFENVTTPMPLTRPSHFAMLASRYPREIGAVNNQSILPADVPTLPETMRRAGYDTAAFTAVKLLGPDSGIARGFDTFEWPGSALHHVAEDVVHRAEGWLEHQPRRRPFLAWVHLFDPHQPYVDKSLPGAPAKPGHPVDWPLLEAEARSHGGDVPRELLDRALQNYAAEVAYTDHWVGRLVGALERTGRLEDTMIVLTADHGECFEDGIFFEHATCLLDGAVRVPLILHDPARIAPDRVARSASTLDLAPTVLAALGLDAPTDFAGRNLLVETAEEAIGFVEHPIPTSGEAALTASHQARIRSVAGVPTRAIAPGSRQIAARSRDWKAILTDESLALYRLGEESVDVSAEHPTIAGDLHRALRVWDHTCEKATPSQQLDAEFLDTLRSLGYVR